MKRMDQLDPMIQSSLAQPFNYQTDDSYTVYDDVVAFQPDWKTLEADWQKWLQFQSMERLSRKVEAQKNERFYRHRQAKTLRYTGIASA